MRSAFLLLLLLGSGQPVFSFDMRIMPAIWEGASQDLAYQLNCSPLTSDPSSYFYQAGNLPCKVRRGTSSVSSSRRTTPASSPKKGAVVLLNVVVAAGGLPPDEPSRQAPTREQLYDALVREMEQALAQLEELIRDKNIKLLLVFDLDGTLYHYPRGDSAEYTEGLGGRLFVKLQQHWFYLLDVFFEKMRSFVIVVYNTSRSYYSSTPDDNNMAASRSRSSRSVSLERQVSWSPANKKKRRLMNFQPNAQHDGAKPIGIPNPDALISGHGGYIQLSRNWKDKVGAGRLQEVNEAINGWVQEDIEVMSRQELKAQTRQPKWEIISSVRAKTLEVFEVPPGIHRRELDQMFECFSTQVAMTEICDANSHLREIIFQNVSVNKGTALRLCTGLITPFIEADGKPVWEVVFGDAVADLPMIRPDLEIAAVDEVSESSLTTRDSRLSTHGFITDRQNMAPWWKLSIMPNKLRFNFFYNQVISSAVQHPKVQAAKGSAVLGMVQLMLRELTAIPSQ